MNYVLLPINDDGSGTWTIHHPDIGPMYVLSVVNQANWTDPDTGEVAVEYAVTLTCARNETVLDEDTLAVNI